jgi:hypothetical protein
VYSALAVATDAGTRSQQVCGDDQSHTGCTKNLHVCTTRVLVLMQRSKCRGPIHKSVLPLLFRGADAKFPSMCCDKGLGRERHVTFVGLARTVYTHLI